MLPDMHQAHYFCPMCGRKLEEQESKGRCVLMCPAHNQRFMVNSSGGVEFSLQWIPSDAQAKADDVPCSLLELQDAFARYLQGRSTDSDWFIISHCVRSFIELLLAPKKRNEDPKCKCKGFYQPPDCPVHGVRARTIRRLTE